MENEDKKDVGGRPTAWRPEFNDTIIAHFSVRAVGLEHDDKGKPYQVMQNIFPTFEGFAHSIDVNTDTLVEWAKPENKAKYVGFSAAYHRAKELQKSFVLQAGLAGAANPAFAIFFAKNNLGMKDKTEQDLTSNGQTLNVMTFSPEDPLARAIKLAADQQKLNDTEHSTQLDSSASPSVIHGQPSEVQSGGMASQGVENVDGDQRTAAVGNDSSGDVLVRGPVS